MELAHKHWEPQIGQAYEMAGTPFCNHKHDVSIALKGKKQGKKRPFRVTKWILRGYNLN